MDKTSLLGIILGVIAVGVGMVLKGVGLDALINPAAFLIIIAGTIASVMVAFPLSTLKKIPALLKIIFTEKKEQNIAELIKLFSEWANQARKEGILSLENQLDKIDDPFLSSGLQLAVDGQTPEFIRDVLLEKIDAMDKRHQEGAAIFSQAGTYAPTLGVLGAVIGLIAALADMTNIDAIGHAIAAAFVATLLGIFTGYVLWHPFANKLKQKSKKEIEVKEIMIEGIISIATGESAKIVKDKLGSYLTSKEFDMLNQEQGNEEE
ncbi:flagellar motor stator protein MotA [Ornithinibacillus bavariensis]|uniref:Motility protein A n=1 Tax=Ornithinibacillus bavariensis TaxID=545502 RepID=A0A919X8Q0_9BACI|nr:flagellar motor stator protein MotA [Ornithinibacillus bavariensis]GIO26467.1 motility protein A [Ornithinibacillus bavariensis]HAM81687.1 flagellar motor protein MotA [Ornithinibacillus sp.]